MDSKFYKEIGDAVERARKNGGSLTEQNMLYVAKVAGDMSAKSGVDFDDLFKEGIYAMKMVEKKYDPSKNNTFIKFAGPSVRGYMLNVINRQSSLVHIPANHMKGFKKGQERVEASKVEYEHIDSLDYDTLGTVENDAFMDDREMILKNGLKRLDINGRKAMEMKLRIGKYSEMYPSKDDPTKMVFRYENNIQAIADELEVPVNVANKIYKDARVKLSTYCQAISNS